MNILTASKQTTLIGIVGAIGVLCTAAYHYLDGDPETTPNLEAVIAAFTILAGLWRSRDNHVSDEQAGAGRTNGGGT